MKSTLSSFGQSDLNNSNDKKQSKNQNNNFTYDQYDKLKNISQSQATQLLFDTVKAQKQAGTFDFEGLQKQVDGFKNYLPKQDFENLQKLLNSLK